MASFAGVNFRVEPNGSFYPNPSRDEGGLSTYSCTAIFETVSARNGISEKVSIVTWQRPLGSMSYNGHVDAGYGDDTLIVPSSGGLTKTYTAVLTEMTSTEGYGREAVRDYRASLKFVLLSDPDV